MKHPEKIQLLSNATLANGASTVLQSTGAEVERQFSPVTSEEMKALDAIMVTERTEGAFPKPPWGKSNPEQGDITSY